MAGVIVRVCAGAVVVVVAWLTIVVETTSFGSVFKLVPALLPLLPHPAKSSPAASRYIPRIANLVM
jgi:hypothetical protein